MINHIVLFRFHPEASTDTVDELATVLTTVAASVEGVEEYRLGRDLGFRHGNDDFAIVSRFRDREAFDAYLSHPEHLAALAKYGPVLVAEKHSVQFDGS